MRRGTTTSGRPKRCWSSANSSSNAAQSGALCRMSFAWVLRRDFPSSARLSSSLKWSALVLMAVKKSVRNCLHLSGSPSNLGKSTVMGAGLEVRLSVVSEAGDAAVGVGVSSARTILRKRSVTAAWYFLADVSKALQSMRGVIWLLKSSAFLWKDWKASLKCWAAG